MSASFDDFVDGTIRRVDNVIFRSFGRTVPVNEMTIRICSDGYARSESKWGKHLELILTFDQVLAAIREERQC